MSAYVINGAANPNLTLFRGQTYTFNVTVGGHPFWIVTAREAGDGNTNAYNDGVTNNGATASGATPGVLTFVVPTSGPAPLFYQCSFHDPMGARIDLVANSVPSGVRKGARRA